MKSLQVLPSLEVGGVERGVVDLARAFKQRGEETVVVSSGGSLVAQLRQIGVTHHELPVHRKSPASLALVGKLASIIERERVDIVHARSRVPAWIAWMAARKTGVPFVTTCHGYYRAHALSRVMGWGKRVIVISRAVGRHMIDDFGVPQDRIRLIHRGIDLSHFRFHPEKYDAVPNVFRIVNLARFTPIKGHVSFLHAVHRLKRDLPNLEVWLVGDSRASKLKYLEEVKTLVRQLELESCVKFLGVRRDVPELLAQADLLVLSTLVPEAFGRALVEGGAVGTAVVSTCVGGVPDVIDHGRNGLLVPPGDPPAMAEAMLSLLTDRGRAKTFAAELRRKIEQQFTLDRMADRTLEVYREVRREKKIVIFKMGAMGDVALATPSFRMIRHRFPEASVSLIVDRRWASLVSACPYLNEIIPVKRERLARPSYLLKLAKHLRRDGYDLSLDLQNSKWTHLLAFLGGVGRRFGFRRGPFGFLLNRGERVPPFAEKPVQNQFRLLTRMGVKSIEEKLELWPDETAKSRVREMLGTSFDGHAGPKIGLVIGSSAQWPSKRWPLESFQRLAFRLGKELNGFIVWIGTREDGSAPDLAALREAGVATEDLITRTSARELAALMGELDVVVTGDTAPLHVAAAMKAKIVALFGPTDPLRHMPPADESVVLSRRLPCQPCYRGDCRIQEKFACLTRIPTDEVFEAVKKIIAPRDRHETRPSPHGPRPAVR